MNRLFTAALLILTLTALLPAAEPNAEQFKYLSGLAQDMDHTTWGIAYEQPFSDAVARDLQKALQGCTQRAVPPFEVNLIFVIDANGKVEHVFADPGSPISACVAAKLSGMRLPKPPKPDWMQLVNINIHG